MFELHSCLELNLNHKIAFIVAIHLVQNLCNCNPLRNHFCTPAQPVHICQYLQISRHHSLQVLVDSEGAAVLAEEKAEEADDAGNSSHSSLEEGNSSLSGNQNAWVSLHGHLHHHQMIH